MALTIPEVERLCKKHDGQAAVVILVRRDGTVDTVTYGETKAKCRTIGFWAERTMAACLSIVPFATVFGWGNGGTPKKLSAKDWDRVRAELGPETQKAFQVPHHPPRSK